MRPWYSQVSTSCQLLIRRAVYTNVSIYGIVLFLLMHNAGTSQYWSAVFCVLPRVVCIKYLFHTLIINCSMKQSVMRDHTRRDADLHCLQRYAVMLTRFCWLSTTNITPAKILAVITCWSTLHDVCTITFGLMTHTWLVAWLSGRTLSLVFDRRAFVVLRLTYSWQLTTYVRKPSAIGQPTLPTQPFILSGSVNE